MGVGYDGIMHYDGGISMNGAERLALKGVLAILHTKGHLEDNEP